ncbi:MAG: hypothetical protein LBJ95_01365 [Oscillospiraceae bacterium]|jgi:hypothetical protein|nr:hypothetical protein [Oscillospiraceae bacterium]
MAKKLNSKDLESASGGVKLAYHSSVGEVPKGGMLAIEEQDVSKFNDIKRKINSSGKFKVCQTGRWSGDPNFGFTVTNSELTKDITSDPATLEELNALLKDI